jgi:hypothetical protein
MASAVSTAIPSEVITNIRAAKISEYIYVFFHVHVVLLKDQKWLYGFMTAVPNPFGPQ